MGALIALQHVGLLGPGVGPMSLVPADGFLPTAPPGKSCDACSYYRVIGSELGTSSSSFATEVFRVYLESKDIPLPTQGTCHLQGM